MNYIRFRASRNKYGNSSCRCSQGHIHDSRFEARYCDQLAMLVKAGEIKSYRTQVRYPLKMNGVTITSHIVDFEVVENSGKIHIEECKGVATREWRIKHKLFEQCYPDIKYYVITMKDGPRVKQRGPGARGI